MLLTKKMKKLSILLLSGILLFTACTSKTKNIAPVNPNASMETRNLLSFLYSIKGKYTLTGQHNFAMSGSKYTELAHEITGKYPVVWGCDFSFNVFGDSAKNFQHCGPMNLTDPGEPFAWHGQSPEAIRSQLISEVKKQYAKGHIITLMWHHCPPQYGDSCDGNKVWAMENRPTSAEWDSLVTEGTTLNTQWKKQADGIAMYLKQLQEANIPVLWRPYHEMNGVWFWWCNQKGPQGFVRLWRMMYHYFTDVHKLNNLIWVWNTNAPRDIPGDEAFPYDQFFPGTEYVDVLAADVYHRDYKQSHHDDLLKLANGKLIALGEIGQLPTPEQLSAQPNWSWFMTWGYFVNKYNDSSAVKAIYNHPACLTLDEINFEKGNWKVKN